MSRENADAPSPRGELREVLSAEVSSLLQTAADLQRKPDPLWTAHVVEANQQLILASLHAERMTETAVHDLDELTRAMQHDELTGTPNRALMLDRLEHAIAVAKRHRTRVAVLFVDLDGFKQINDLRGHAIGDEVLKSAARALESVVRKSDTVSRHGGDEFLVLLAEVSHSTAAAVIAAKMLSALAAPVRVGADLLSLSGSIGIAIFPDDGDDASVLIHRADKAMYRSKREAPGRYAFYRETANWPGAASPVADDSSRALAPEISPLPGDQPIPQPEGGRAEAARRQLIFQADVANALRSSFTSTQEILTLLSQVQTEQPLLQVLIEKETAHLSTRAYESFASPRSNSARFTRYETAKTGQFDAVSADGARYAVLEFTVTARSGAMDHNRRLLTEKSFGLTNGDRIDRVNSTEFQIAETGVMLRRG